MSRRKRSRRAERSQAGRATRQRGPRSRVLAALVIGALVLGAGALAVYLVRAGAPAQGVVAPALPPAPSAPAPPPATYVGRESCVGCHAQAVAKWQGSHHDLAMQVADEASVLGNFADAKFRHAGVTSTFFRRDGKYFVRTDGPDGKLADFEIRYTFGVDALAAVPDRVPGRSPPGAQHRLGCATPLRRADSAGSTCTRTRRCGPATRCTGRAFSRTGTSCARSATRPTCARTTTRRATASRPASPRSTSRARPATALASNHVAWARREGDWQRASTPTAGLAIALDERRNVRWTIDAATGNAQRSRARETAREVEMCGRCHARASRISDDYVHGKPLLDSHRVALLEEGLYWSDGQMRDEVYEHGSFLQSRMFAKGVTCSDCHEPHSLKLTRARRRRVRAVSPAGEVRRAAAPLPSRGLAGRGVRRLPHADRHLHADRSPPRSLPADPAARPLGLARHPERLQRLPHEAVAAVGRRARSASTIRSRSPASRALPRRSTRARGESPERSSGWASSCAMRRSRRSCARARPQRLAAPARSRGDRHARERARRSRSARALRRGRGAVGRGSRAARAAAAPGARRSRSDGAHRSGARARVGAGGRAGALRSARRWSRASPSGSPCRASTPIAPRRTRIWRRSTPSAGAPSRRSPSSRRRSSSTRASAPRW